MKLDQYQSENQYMLQYDRKTSLRQGAASCESRYCFLFLCIATCQCPFDGSKIRFKTQLYNRVGGEKKFKLNCTVPYWVGTKRAGQVNKRSMFVSPDEVHSMPKVKWQHQRDVSKKKKQT